MRLLVELGASEAAHVEAGHLVRWVVALRLLVVLGLVGDVAELAHLPLGPDHGEHVETLARREMVRAASVAVREEPPHRAPAGLPERLSSPANRLATAQDTRIVTHAPHDGQVPATLR